MADNIGASLTAWRISRYPTQAAAARAIGVTPARYGNWERGIATPRRNEMRKLRELGFVPPDELPSAVHEASAPYYTRTTPTQLRLLVETLYSTTADDDLRAEARRELYRLLQLPANDPSKKL